MASSSSLRDPSLTVVLSPTSPEPPAGPAPAGSGTRPPTLGDDSGGVWNRNQQAILDGARRAVLAHGHVITMAEVAVSAGVARDTVHRHFTGREDLLVALLRAEIDEAVAATAHLDLRRALIRAAETVSGHPLLEALAGDQVAVLAAMSRIDVTEPGWARVAAAVDSALTSAGRRGTPMVLRWLASFLLAPAEPADIAADVDVLLAGLPTARARTGQVLAG